MNCEHCRIGHIQPISTPYIQWLDGQIFIIPDATAFSCDVCGHMEYDAKFIYKLNYLLDKLSEHPPNESMPSQQMMTAASPPRPLVGRR